MTAPAITLGSLPSITVSSGNITAPPLTLSSPTTTIVVPATMTGSFFAVCELPNPDDFSCAPSSLGLPNISIDLPGMLTVNFLGLRHVGSAIEGGYIVEATESFTTIPEPPAIFLFLLGILVVITSSLCRWLGAESRVSHE